MNLFTPKTYPWLLLSFIAAAILIEWFERSSGPLVPPQEQAQRAVRYLEKSKQLLKD